jgi:hypothetical protein
MVNLESSAGMPRYDIYQALKCNDSNDVAVVEKFHKPEYT